MPVTVSWQSSKAKGGGVATYRSLKSQGIEWKLVNFLGLKGEVIYCKGFYCYQPAGNRLGDKVYQGGPKFQNTGVLNDESLKSEESASREEAQSFEDPLYQLT